MEIKQNVSESIETIPSPKQKNYFWIPRPKQKKNIFGFLDPNKKKIFLDSPTQTKKNIFGFLDPNKKKICLDSSIQRKKIFLDSSNPNKAFSWQNSCCCFQLVVDCFVSWSIVSSAESRSWK